MTTDDGVTTESTVVNVRLSSGSVPLQKFCMFNDSDINKLYSYCLFLTLLTPLTWLQIFLDCRFQNYSESDLSTAYINCEKLEVKGIFNTPPPRKLN